MIHRPVDVVAGHAGDPGNAPEWYANTRSVAWPACTFAVAEPGPFPVETTDTWEPVDDGPTR